jgi:acyl carrier protein
MEDNTTNGVADRQHVAATIVSIISDLLDRELGEVREDAELEGQLGLDSIHRVELSAQISKAFGISVGVDDLDIVDTFGELLDAVVDAGSGSTTKQA